MRRLLDAFWAWAAERRDDVVSRALHDAPPGPTDLEHEELLREEGRS
jgi:hypothetical protein